MKNLVDLCEELL